MATNPGNSAATVAEEVATMDVDLPTSAVEACEDGQMEKELSGSALENGKESVCNEPSCSTDSDKHAPGVSKNKRRMKKDDSGISVDKFPDEDDDKDKVDENEEDRNSSSCGEDALPVFTRRTGHRPKTFRRYKVKKTEDLSDKSSPDSGHHDSEFRSMDFASGPEESSSDPPDASNPEQSPSATNGVQTEATNGKESNSDSKYLYSDEDEEAHSAEHSSSSEDEDDESNVVAKPKPKHNWFLCPEVTKRQYGISNNYSNDLFRLRAYGSLHMVERLELMYKMKRHEGCVNTLHFNGTGTRLVSGSDDLTIVIWDWAYGVPVLTYDSGHRSNVFQAKFMPLVGDCHIVSCARDGVVRLAELSSTGVCKGTRKLANHRGPAHKLALEPDSPHTFISVGEDGVVFQIDLRESKPDKLLTCKENDFKVPLYTVFAHPTISHEFAIGGKDHFVRIYDKRKIQEDSSPMKKYCPHHLISNTVRANVTCLVYNYNGSELLASYNDEDIYAFDTSHSDGAEFVHRYRGHRNNATVKGVNYFGPKSEFIVSGSDCGNIYLWEHHSETVIQFMPGDEGGVVNCLEPHPNMPVLATSGLDDDIKIWVPSCEKAPKLCGLRSTMRSNRKERDHERHREPETIDGQMLWFLMHHLRRSARRRAREEGQTYEDASSDDESAGDSDDSENMSHAVQCAPS